ncbi:MAG: hypothetical protein ACYCT2_00005 [Thermoplasmataceae archaeon]
MKGRKLTYALVFFVAVLVVLSGTLYYYNSGKKVLPLQGPFISIEGIGLPPSSHGIVANFSAYVYLTTVNSSSSSNDVLLYSGLSTNGRITGYLNDSFYSLTGAWNSLLQSPSDNISLSLYAFYDSVSDGRLNIYSYYNNLPYNPDLKRPISFNVGVRFNLSMPDLVMPIPINLGNLGYFEKMLFINSSTVQNSSIVLGSYFNSSNVQAFVSLGFYPSNASNSNQIGYASFRGITYTNDSGYAQESANSSFSGDTFNLSGVPSSIDTNSILSLGPVDLHVSNFYLYSGYVKNGTFNRISTNYQTTMKVSSANSTMKVFQTNIENHSFLPYFNKFFGKYTTNVTKVLKPSSGGSSGTAQFNDLNWTYVNSSLNLNLSGLFTGILNSTVLYTNLGLSLLVSDFSSHYGNTNFSPASVLSEQMGNNMLCLSNFNGITLIRTDGIYYERNLIINSDGTNLSAGFLFSSTNISLDIFSKSYFGPLPITAVMIS